MRRRACVFTSLSCDVQEEMQNFMLQLRTALTTAQDPAAFRREAQANADRAFERAAAVCATGEPGQEEGGSARQEEVEHILYTTTTTTTITTTTTSSSSTTTTTTNTITLCTKIDGARRRIL